jgi:MFS family permease
MEPRRLLRDPNLQVIFGVTLMAVLGVSTITPVLPYVAGVFDRTPQSVALLIVVFTLPSAILTPVLGVMGDRLGRKKVLVPSLLVFALAGSACGFARSFDWLLALRFVQGSGAAAIGAINVTLLGDLYRGVNRAAAMGYNASVLSVGTGIYPAVGGALAVLGWYFPFFLPILALPVALAVVLVLENPEPSVEGTLAQYVRVTLRAVWRPQVLTLFVTSVVTFVLIYGSFLAFLPFLLEESFAASPMFIGAVMSATSIATAIVSFMLGDLAQRFGTRALVKAGFVLYAVSLAAIPLATSVWALGVPILLFGVANGLNIPSVLTILNGYAPDQYRAAFMSLNGTVLRLGQTLGPVLVGVAVEVVGLRQSFWVSAAVALAMLIVLVPALRPEPEVADH